MAAVKETGSPEPSGQVEDAYDHVLRVRREFVERQHEGKVLVRSEEREFKVNRQARIKMYLNPIHLKDTALHNWIVFINDIRTHSGRHRHQGGLALFVLEGEGSTEIDGRRLDWKAGDLILLPVKPQGCEHQHFNRNPGKRTQWMAFSYRPFEDSLGHSIVQVTNSPDYVAEHGGPVEVAGVEARDLKRAQLLRADEGPAIKSWPRLESPNELSGAELYKGLLALRNQQRHDLASSQWLIRGDELPWEINPQGKMKWYMHPFMSYLACRTFVFYLQEISPHSRSGRVRQQGDQVIYFIKGSGHTILDGKSYPWKVGDMINVPIRPDGVELQHFNDGNEPAQFIAVEPNLLGTFGVDRGAGYEQLEVAPEYQTLAPG